MAQVNKSTTMRIRVMTGETDGRETFANRSISNINPSISDDDLLEIGTATGALLADATDQVIRENSATLVA